jgi:hypothetical protein
MIKKAAKPGHPPNLNEQPIKPAPAYLTMKSRLYPTLMTENSRLCPLKDTISRLRYPLPTFRQKKSPALIKPVNPQFIGQIRKKQPDKYAKNTAKNVQLSHPIKPSTNENQSGAAAD